MTTIANPYNWPPTNTERDLRNRADTAEAKVAAAIALIVTAEGKDGRVPACQLRKALDLPPKGVSA